MIIEYIGHSCFYLTNEEGVRILIDPYDSSIGLQPVERTADVVLITHDHHDHNHVDGISGDYERIDKVGTFSPCGVKVTGIKVPHDDEGGAERGMVVSYVIETDHMRLLHMGDVGDMPSDDVIEQYGTIDILMIPVGGTYTVDAAGAKQIMEKIKPNITIPMHFKTKRLTLDIDRVKPFIDLVRVEFDVSRLGSNKFNITADNLKKRRRILLMENSY